jgi:hypothetical protein
MVTSAAASQLARTWLIVGLLTGLLVFVLSPAGLPLALAELVVAVIASCRVRSSRLAGAYLLGIGVMGLAVTAALSIESGAPAPSLLLGFATAAGVGVLVLRWAGAQETVREPSA